MARAFGGTVGVGRVGERATVLGAAPCTLRSCPNCGPRIQAGRRDEIAAAVRAAKDRGWSVAFLTLTLSHGPGDALDALFRSLLDCWRRASSGRPFADIRSAYGVRGFVRVVEMKHGANGWHPHLHVLLFWDPESCRAPGSRPIRAAGTATGRAKVDRSGGSRTVRDQEPAPTAGGAGGVERGRLAQGLSDALVHRWLTIVHAAGLRASVAAQKLLDVTDADVDVLSGYLAKESADGIAWEMTGQDSKISGASLTPFEILEAAVHQPSFRSLWIEYEQAISGRRLIGWSGGLRDMLGQPPAADDDDLAQEQEPERTEVLVVLAAEAWSQLAGQKGGRGGLLGLVEQGAGASELVAWLARRGIAGVPFSMYGGGDGG